MTDGTKASVLDVYQRHGTTWAKLRGGKLSERSWLDRFCNHLLPGAAVLDIGCGSGVPIARELIRRGFDVTGVDATQTMLALFRNNLPGITAHLMDMRQLALGRRFAGLLAWDSFFHLSPDDQRSMFGRFQAHAEPGTVLMFTSGNVEGIAVGELEGDSLYHSSLGPDEYRALLDAAGFEVITHVMNDPSCGQRTIWLTRQRD
ncbi:dTDP-3-amino-3,4,6-trideoxy-alpha-D-glucopyranose [Sphingopyxis sp. LC81]|uniref:class I SAM-dependent DNA methyltransferase n=1 Tax=Sphingopyxis sp. LC81 TaxID=1502850 RepID=UPI0005101101|nr:class I SAM-dependent methyltransferase [Sphingopyxis sp. LC81]KGB54831.1 dTDP-3-amino-3,4,6-trideoxy-alpha-D-glucopyranose [Sphingopyxis sp. LC81]